MRRVSPTERDDRANKMAGALDDDERAELKLLRTENLALKLENTTLREAAGAPACATLSLEDRKEPILQENPGRYVLFPIQYDETWRWYKKAQASIWTAEEVDLGNDMQDWEKLTDEEKFFVKNVLAFFAASDGIVVRAVFACIASSIVQGVLCGHRMKTWSSASAKRCSSPRPSSSTAFKCASSPAGLPHKEPLRSRSTVAGDDRKRPQRDLLAAHRHVRAR